MDQLSLLAALQREVLRLQEQLTAMRFSVAELVCDVKKLTRAQSEPPDNDAAEVRMALQRGVLYVLGCNVPGDIAEFGTMSGRTAAALAHAMKVYDHLQDIHDGGVERHPRKALHLFDSFQGLPVIESDVDRRSPHVVSGTWSAGSLQGIPAQDLLDLCVPHLNQARVRIHAGWFRDTLPCLPLQTRFSLLHIDCDLYQSAKDVLDHCFSRGLIENGAAIFFDDWNCNAANAALGERRAWAEAVEAFNIHATDCGEYGMGARKFIVHSYAGRSAAAR